MKNFFIKATDLFFCSRPVLLIPVWAFFLFGYYHGCLVRQHTLGTVSVEIPSTGLPVYFFYSLPGKTWLVILLFSLLMSATYILNQIADVDTDRKNRGFPLLAKGVIQIREARTLAIGLTAGVIVSAIFINKEFFLLFSAAALIGIVYNLPPFRFSGRPVLDFLSNAAGYGFLAFFLGWLTAGAELSGNMVIAATPYFLLMAAGSIASTVPDIPGDRAENKITTSVWLGIRKSACLGLVCIIAAFLTAFPAGDWIVLSAAVPAAASFLLLVVKPEKKNAYPAYQFGGGILILIALALYPLFLLLSVFFFIVTRIYFKARHGIHYPSLGK